MTLATVPLIVGTVLALAVVLFARASGFDRSRAFYPTVLVVTASYYVLFAVIYGAGSDLASESVIMAIFLALAVVGFRISLWVVVAGSSPTAFSILSGTRCSRVLGFHHHGPHSASLSMSSPQRAWRCCWLWMATDRARWATKHRRHPGLERPPSAEEGEGLDLAHRCWTDGIDDIGMTDFPPPPGFAGYKSRPYDDVDDD